MIIKTEPYLSQQAHWPTAGRHIMAQFDDESIIVYQAYNRAIADWAIAHGTFGGPFKMDRMTWIKPNFLWMMFRCGWAQKPNQEAVLAIRMKRCGFDSLLAQAIHSSYVEAIYESESIWQQAVKSSSVRLQWDPDHDPKGNKISRRAIQLGLRGQALEQYVNEWIIAVEDITPLVSEQRCHTGLENLLTPSERVYPLADNPTRTKLGLAERPTE